MHAKSMRVPCGDRQMRAMLVCVVSGESVCPLSAES
jgi:hypothetical protein